MKLKFAIDPDVVALMAAEVAAGERAVTTALREAGTSLKSAWRGQITGADFGRHQRGDVRTDLDLQLHGRHAGRKSTVQTSRSRSRTGSP